MSKDGRTLLMRLDVPCPTCKAQSGQPCRRPNGDKVTNYYGRPDYHAARKGRVFPPGSEPTP